MKLASIHKEDQFLEVSQFINDFFEDETFEAWHLSAYGSIYKNFGVENLLRHFKHDLESLNESKEISLYPLDYSLRVEAEEVYGNYICMKENKVDRSTSNTTKVLQV